MRRGSRTKETTRYLGLTIAEWLTAVIGVGSIVTAAGSLWISWLTYQNSRDTRDLKVAVSNLSELAKQTKRQADALNGQLELVRSQVGEAKRQTAAISKQTSAIQVSSEAQVKSADAQKRAADLGASAVRVRIALSTLNIEGFDTKTAKDGLVEIKLRPQFANVGGVSFVTGEERISLFTGSQLPPTPDYSGAGKVGGNDLAVQPHSTFGATNPLITRLPTSTVQDILDGKKFAYVYGTVEYVDATDRPGRWCFAVQVVFSDGAPNYFKTVGGPAYHCET
jgi:hypothetical protein